MFAVLGIIKVKPEFLAVFIEHVRLHAGKSLAEPGCLRYDVLQDRDDPHTICLYEIFRSEADLEVHHRQEHYREWMAMSADWRDRSNYSRRTLTLIFPSLYP
jgi:(4S)-4-hydroxy-5-phosphonooxypentane-2,3-dione isomerase